MGNPFRPLGDFTHKSHTQPTFHFKTQYSLDSPSPDCSSWRFVQADML